MADSKISALPASTTPLAGTEVLPIVQSSATKQVSVANLTAGRAISATQLTLTTGNLIVASGQGIDFSATPGTGTSELLDDYEKGTWSPQYSTDGTPFTSVSMESATVGTYTKIGNRVYISGRIRVESLVVGAATGGVTLSNLPFTVGEFSALSLSRALLFAVNFPLSGFFFKATTYVNLQYRLIVNGADANLAVTDLNTFPGANDIMFSGCYNV